MFYGTNILQGVWIVYFAQFNENTCESPVSKILEILLLFYQKHFSVKSQSSNLHIFFIHPAKNKISGQESVSIVI